MLLYTHNLHYWKSNEIREMAKKIIGKALKDIEEWRA